MRLASLLLLLSFSCTAQVTATKLLKMSLATSFKDFNSLAVAEDFKMNVTMGHVGTDGNQYSYIAQAAHDSTATTDYLSYLIFNDKSEAQVFFGTDLTSLFNSLMQGFKNEGFYFDRDINDNEDVPTAVYISDYDLSYYILVRKYPVTAEGRWRYYIQLRKFYKW